jgi:hypothetical protein
MTIKTKRVRVVNKLTCCILPERDNTILLSSFRIIRVAADLSDDTRVFILL